MTSETLKEENSPKLNSEKHFFKEERVRVLSNVNSYLRKRLFAHHPDCDRYDHHVFKVFGWVLCVGDTGVYSAILASVLWYLFISDTFWNLDSLSLFGLGMLFFTPAIIQLFWKSERKSIKFLMRFSLGISIFYLLLFIFSFSELYWKLFYLGIFIIGVFLYNQNNSKKHFYECSICPYGEVYNTCLRRQMGLLRIDGIEKIQDISSTIGNILTIKTLRLDDFEKLNLEYNE
jgi:hypothetical protein